MPDHGRARPQPTLLAVHAHPDDEATSTGGMLARYGAEGVRTVLVTCTNGELGDGPGGVKPGDAAHDPAEVARIRRAELERSCEILAVTELELLGFADSGMAGWPQNNDPRCFSSRPLSEGVELLAPLIEHYRPDVVVTYDADGYYGHPDHIQAHRVTVAALEALGQGAPRLFHPVTAQSDWHRWPQLVADAGIEWELPSEPMRSMAYPDGELAAVVDCRPYAGRAYAALAAHASQAENTPFLRFGVERFGELFGIESFAGAKPSGARGPLTDLFAAGALLS